MKRRFSAVFLSLLIGSLSAYGQTYQSSFENSRALLKEKRYSEALQEAQRAIALDGSQWGAYYVAGTALVGLERQGEAINLFQSALAHAPEKAKPTINTAIEACHQVLASKSQAPEPSPSSPQYPQAQPSPLNQSNQAGVAAQRTQPAPVGGQMKVAFQFERTPNMFVVGTLGLSPEEWNDFDLSGGTLTLRHPHNMVRRMYILDARGLSLLVGSDGQFPRAEDDGRGHQNLNFHVEETIPCASLGMSVRFPSPESITISSIRYFSTVDLNHAIRNFASSYCGTHLE